MCNARGRGQLEARRLEGALAANWCEAARGRASAQGERRWRGSGLSLRTGAAHCAKQCVWGPLQMTEIEKKRLVTALEIGALA
jgi:hypothetical protein